MTFNRDSVLLLVYAAANAGLSYAAAHGYLSQDDALNITEVLTAFAVAFHIPNAKASAALKEQAAVPPPDDPPVDAEAAGRSE